MLFETYECDTEKVSKNENEESYEILDSEGARISSKVPPGKLLLCIYDDVRTITDAIERGCKLSGNGRCLGWRSSESEYSWITFKDFISRAQNFGTGLEKATIKLGQSSLIGIYGQNSVEWLAAQYGCLYNSSPIVPLYDTIGPYARTFMINHAEIEVVICDVEKKVKAVLEKSEETSVLKYIIHMKDISEETKLLAKKKNITLYSFAVLEELGKSNPRPVKGPKPSDMAMVLYTSGTTGDPKGAIITHQSIIAEVSGIIMEVTPLVPNSEDVCISYLPLAHAFEQIIEIYVFIHGGSLGFFSGDVSLLINDMKAVKPTIFPAVPRMLTKFHDIAKSLAGKLKENVQGLEEKDHKSGANVENTDNDSVIYKALSDLLGGKVRLIFTGTAPITEKTLVFYKKALGCEIIEAFGQTECSGACTLSVVSLATLGAVGPPMPTSMLKLEDVPELGYFKRNKIGEVCVKGTSVFSGYLKNPEKTAEAVDEEGWLHTGDVGKWLPNGTLKIVDRKKHIFKLSQGEYIMPEKIENIYLESPFISQIFVHGDSLQNFLIAIVIPEEKELIAWCRNKSINGAMMEICKNQAVKEFILADMKKFATTAGLLSFQQAKDIYLHPTLLTVENGLMTPTQKTKRHDVRKFFTKEIQAMYNKTS